MKNLYTFAIEKKAQRKRMLVFSKSPKLPLILACLRMILCIHRMPGDLALKWF
jgi:hypothetical protein